MPYVPRGAFSDDHRDNMSQSARERWNRERRAEIEVFLADFEEGHLQRQAIIGLRVMARAIRDGQLLSDEQKTLLRAVRGLRGSTMYNAATTPYVSPHDTRHPPMTGTHTHDHAAFESGDHDDGIHGGDGPHTHNGDADHDHPDQHPHHDGHTHSHVGAEGMYGAEMSGKLGPAARAASRRARIENLDRRRGGSA